MTLLRFELHGYLKIKYIGNPYISNLCKRKLEDLNITPYVNGKDL